MKNISTSVGVKLEDAVITFMKNKINELVFYLNNYLMKEVLWKAEIETTKEPAKPSTFYLEVVILNAKLKMFKNSLSDKYLLLIFDKLAVWTTG